MTVENVIVIGSGPAGTAAGTGCAAALDAEHYLAAHGLASHDQSVTALLDDVQQVAS
jgi:thioredoxin reductase